MENKKFCKFKLTKSDIFSKFFKLPDFFFVFPDLSDLVATLPKNLKFLRVTVAKKKVFFNLF